MLKLTSKYKPILHDGKNIILGKKEDYVYNFIVLSDSEVNPTDKAIASYTIDLVKLFPLLKKEIMDKLLENDDNVFQFWNMCEEDIFEEEYLEFDTVENRDDFLKEVLQRK